MYFNSYWVSIIFAIFFIISWKSISFCIFWVKIIFWIFSDINWPTIDKKGSISFDSENVDFDKLFEASINLDADDVEEDEDTYRVLTSVENFQTVVEGLEKEGFKSTTAEFTRIPKNTIDVTDEKTAQSVMRLIDRLEELDDVQNVYANCEISDDIAQNLEV